MKKLNTTLKNLAVSTALLSVIAASYAENTHEESTTKLLTAHFDSRKVVQIEAGDFHFLPGQVAPIHTHSAPAIGYVSKGEIIYQVEGEKPQLLREGDAFYEPVGPRILRFDNASATEEAIFIDFNLEQKDEPFIVFEKELTEHIDRRTLPTVAFKKQKFERADIFVTELEPKGRKVLKRKQPILGYVAEGVINLNIKGQQSLRIVAGETFSLPKDKSTASVENASPETPAKVIAFYLR